jgi:hypothetical protein
MALKTVQLKIDDIEFSTTQFPAMRALEVMVNLQRLTAGMNPDQSLAQAAPHLMAGLDGPAARKLVMDLFESTTALLRTPTHKIVTLNSQANIDLVFNGKLKMLFQVVAHAIEVNFGDFGEGSDGPAPLTQTPEQ